MKRILYRVFLILLMVAGVHLAGKITKAIACASCNQRVVRSCASGLCAWTNRLGCFNPKPICYETQCVINNFPYTTQTASICAANTPNLCFATGGVPGLDLQCLGPKPIGC